VLCLILTRKRQTSDPLRFILQILKKEVLSNLGTEGKMQTVFYGFPSSSLLFSSTCCSYSAYNSIKTSIPCLRNCTKPHGWKTGFCSKILFYKCKKLAMIYRSLSRQWFIVCFCLCVRLFGFLFLVLVSFLVLRGFSLFLKK